MKAALISLLVVMAMIATGVALVEPQSSTSASHLSHKQADHLINTASTPEDHRELAKYFRQKAQRNREKQEYYLEIAWTYQLHPPRVDMYRNLSTSDLYRHSADEARQLALADERLASAHEYIALQLSQAK